MVKHHHRSVSPSRRSHGEYFECTSVLYVPWKYLTTGIPSPVIAFSQHAPVYYYRDRLGVSAEKPFFLPGVLNQCAIYEKCCVTSVNIVYSYVKESQNGYTGSFELMHYPGK